MIQSNISLKSSVSQFVIVLVVILSFGVLLAVRGEFSAPIAFVIGLVCGVILASTILDLAETCPGCEERTGEEN